MWQQCLGSNTGPSDNMHVSGQLHQFLAALWATSHSWKVFGLSFFGQLIIQAVLDFELPLETR